MKRFITVLLIAAMCSASALAQKGMSGVGVNIPLSTGDGGTALGIGVKYYYNVSDYFRLEPSAEYMVITPGGDEEYDIPLFKGFLNCDFSERHAIKTERFERIVVSAMKQSRKGWRPRVNDMVAFKKWVETPREGLKFIAHCYDDVEKKDLFSLLAEADKTEDVTVMIGPEGDFSREEVALAEAHGFVSVTLGESRLRTETAGLSAVMMAQLTKRI